MPSEQIQWFPGHMAKTRRLISEDMKEVDAVLELLDARIPRSSRNPDIAALLSGKPTVTLLNKSSLSDPSANAEWTEYFKTAGKTKPILIDSVTGEGVGRITPALRELLADKIEHWQSRGMTGRRIKVMIVGVPNVGKSTLINRLVGERKAKAEDRPGVTRQKQWVLTKTGLNLLDTPGVLWPKFDDRKTGEALAFTGAIKDDILDTETLASALCGRLRRLYPDALCARYKLSAVPDDMTDHELLLAIGRKRGFLVSGGEVDSERTALMLLDEFRSAKIGRITLERPNDLDV